MVIRIQVKTRIWPNIQAQKVHFATLAGIIFLYELLKNTPAHAVEELQQ